MLKTAGIALALVTGILATISADTASAGGGCHTVAPGFSDSPSGTVSMNACKFVPAVVRIDPGHSIQWSNDDNVPHMVAGVAGSWGYGEVYDTGDTTTHTFSKTGVYPYFCELHPGMVGAVVVGDGAVTASTTNEVDLAVLSDLADAGAPQDGAAVSGAGDGRPAAQGFIIAGIAALVMAAAGGLVVLRLTHRIPKT